MIGAPGCGKTHICASMTEWALSRFNTIRYHKEENLLLKLRRAVNDNGNDWALELKYLVDDDFVILDDVASGILDATDVKRSFEFKAEVLYAFLDLRCGIYGKPTIITSNLNRKEFETLYHPRTTSRLFARKNTVIDMSDFPDHRA